MAEDALLTRDCAAMAPLNGIAELLVHIREAGGERFDPSGWHYLDSLAKRALEQNDGARHLLEAKVERAIVAFSERLNAARSSAAALLESACSQHPTAASELKELFANNDFKGLRRQCARLEARRPCAALAELVWQLEPASESVPGKAPQPAAARINEVHAPTLELKTVRESRASWARMSVDKQLAKAMDQAPQNAGPINSHMLILRSLAMMRDISPDYLSHIVTYIDTLVSLDPGETETPVKKKKAVTTKAAKPAKALKK